MTKGIKNFFKRWRCGVSIPVPLACKANALPYELHPLPNTKGELSAEEKKSQG